MRVYVNLSCLDVKSRKDKTNFVAQQFDFCTTAEGLLEVIQNGKLLGEMHAGTAFGELAILYNCKRTASVKGESLSLISCLYSHVSVDSFRQVDHMYIGQACPGKRSPAHILAVCSAALNTRFQKPETVPRVRVRVV